MQIPSDKSDFKPVFMKNSAELDDKVKVYNECVEQC